MNNVLQKAVPHKPNITTEMRNALKSLKQDHSIMILPAEKGCASVVLDTALKKALLFYVHSYTAGNMEKFSVQTE